MNDKVSIVVTVYNLSKYISRCLDSIINQTHNNLQIIIVNDCSTDNSLDIVREYEAKDNRIEVVDNEINVGAGMSRRIGISHSNGNYISMIDGDDYVSEDFISKLLELSIRYDADMVTGNVKVIGGETFSFSNTENEYITFKDKLMFLYQQKMKFINNKLFRKSLFDKVEYSSRRFIEDTPTLYRLIYYTNKVVTVPNNNGSFYFYDMRDNSLTHKSDKFKWLLYTANVAMEVYEFLEDKEDDARNLLSVYQLRNCIGFFIYDKDFDEKKIEDKYPIEYKEFKKNYNKLKNYIY